MGQKETERLGHKMMLGRFGTKEDSARPLAELICCHEAASWTYMPGDSGEPGNNNGLRRDKYRFEDIMNTVGITVRRKQLSGARRQRRVVWAMASFGASSDVGGDSMSASAALEPKSSGAGQAPLLSATSSFSSGSIS